METTVERVKAAGYTDIRRHAAVDAKKENLQAAWARHGISAKQFSPRDRDFIAMSGKQACALSWLDLLRHIAMNATTIPFATVFEDDVLFHKDWATLAPRYWTKTPKDFDLCYLGAQLDETLFAACVDSVPAYCTHAILLTAAGAGRIYNFIISQQVYTIDCMLRDAQIFGPEKCPFIFYTWNAKNQFPDETAVMPDEWAKRNCGLVFQDWKFGTDVCRPPDDPKLTLVDTIL